MLAYVMGDLGLLVAVFIALLCISSVEGYIEPRAVEPIKFKVKLAGWVLSTIAVALIVKIVAMLVYLKSGGLPCTLGY